MELKFMYLTDFQSVIQLAAALNIALGVAPQLRNAAARLYAFERDATEKRAKDMISNLLDGNEYFRLNNLPFSETRILMHQKLSYRYKMIQDLISRHQEELSIFEYQETLGDVRSSRKFVFFGFISVVLLFASSIQVAPANVNGSLQDAIPLTRAFFASQLLFCALLYLPVLQSIKSGLLVQRQINKRRAGLDAEIKATVRDILDA